MHRLLALLVLLGAGVSLAQPTLYAQDVLDLIVAQKGGVGGDIWLGVNGGFEHPVHSELTVNVDAHMFRTAFLEDGEITNSVIACGIGVGACVYQGQNLIGFGWTGSIFIQAGPNCNNEEKPFRDRYDPFNGSLSSYGTCATAPVAAAAAATRYWDYVFMKDYQEMGGSWELTYLPHTVVPSPPTKDEFESTVWAGVQDGIEKYTCSTCTVAALAEYGVFIDGSYVDGGAYDPENPPGGDPDDPGSGGGGTDWGSAPDDEITSCSIIDIPCNLRRLFVPQIAWGDRLDDLWTVAGNKPPLGYIGFTAQGDGEGSGPDAPLWWHPTGFWADGSVGGGSQEWDNMCAHMAGNYLSFDFRGSLDEAGAPATFRNNLVWDFAPVCESAPATAYRDTIRPVLGVLIVLLAVIWAVQLVRGA